MKLIIFRIKIKKQKKKQNETLIRSLSCGNGDTDGVCVGISVTTGVLHACVNDAINSNKLYFLYFN